MTGVPPSTDWLPALVTLEQHGGDWPAYLEAVHRLFVRDFVASKPCFPGKRVALKRYPDPDGRGATFWHMVSEGKVETDRTPDLRRCERIGWPRPLIEELAAVLAGAGRVRCWCEDRKGAKRIIIAVADFSYVLVLDDRGDYVLPWTAYAVEREHQRQKLEKAWTAAKVLQKAGAAPWEDGPVTPATPGG